MANARERFRSILERSVSARRQCRSPEIPVDGAPQVAGLVLARVDLFLSDRREVR